MNKDDEVDDNTLKAIEIIQGHSTKRVQSICIAIVVGLGIISFTIVELTTPAWQTVVLALIAAFFGPSSFVVMMIKIYGKNVKKNNTRTAKLEKHLDPRHSSSVPSFSERYENDELSKSVKELPDNE